MAHVGGIACGLTWLSVLFCSGVASAHSAIHDVKGSDAVAVALNANAPSDPALASIDGYVLSRDSMPIFGVLVTSPSVTQETRTDSSGYFRLDGFGAGEHTITARSLGFEPVSAKVQTESDGVFKATLIIGANIQRLRAVRVISEDSMIHAVCRHLKTFTGGCVAMPARS